LRTNISAPFSPDDLNGSVTVCLVFPGRSNRFSNQGRSRKKTAGVPLSPPCPEPARTGSFPRGYV